MKYIYPLFLILIASMGCYDVPRNGSDASKIQSVSSASTQEVNLLKEGTYELVNPKDTNCCRSDLKLQLRIKPYQPNRYYVSLEGFADSSMYLGCYPCSKTYLIEWNRSHTQLLQKDEVDLDSVQVSINGDDIVNIQHFSAKDSLLNQKFQFKYLKPEMYPIFNYDAFNRYGFVPKVSKELKMSCYEYPDETFSSTFFFFNEDSILLANEVVDTKDINKKFSLIYFWKKTHHSNGYYKDYKYHLWVKKEDLLKYFAVVPGGHI